MAAAVVSQASQPIGFGVVNTASIGPDASVAPDAHLFPKPHDVYTSLAYHKPNEDGSPPHPTYVDKPETYERPVEWHDAVIHDVTGRESEFTLDGNGFQYYRHDSREKDFVDDDHIKAVYYPEVDQLLKDV